MMLRLVILVVTLILGLRAEAATYDWEFRVEALSDGFAGPPSFMGEDGKNILGSGALITSDTGVKGNFGGSGGDDQEDGYPATSYKVTGITGTLAGHSITGLLPDGSTMTYVSEDGSGGFTADNTLAVVKLEEGETYALGPAGGLVVVLDKPLDEGEATLGRSPPDGEGNKILLSSDPFFGAFADTQKGNEWQGSLRITKRESTSPSFKQALGVSVANAQTVAVPEPAGLAVLGIGLLHRRRT
jgi:hypothetical protein